MLAHEIIKQKPQNIVTFLDQEDDDILKEFRCTGCGRFLFEYYGGVRLIMPGGITIDMLDIVGRPKSIVCKNKRKVKMPNGQQYEVKCNIKYFVIG